jgi:uncharacterized protein (DUF433 family)
MKLPDFLIDHSDGVIRLIGHRIGLCTVVRDYKEGRSAEEITQEYETLPLELVRGVIAFYLANKPEVDAYVEACRVKIEQLAADYVPRPGHLRVRRMLKKLEEAEAHNSNDPSWKGLSLGEKINRLGLLNHEGNK